ncbi:4-hydroxy-3-methylbut-2-enyl diphosphate reductase [Thermodesulfobacteriota bacterium]
MKVTVAKHAGFCMGVKKAMNMALEASESSSEQIYTLGPLVHNSDAVNMLRKNNVVPAKESGDLHDKKVFIRAHGVPPSVQESLKEKHNDVIDATCPNVVKVQKIAAEYVEKGYDVIIVGDHGHAEVDGLLGYCEDRGYVVANATEALALPKLNKACVIAQTTQNREYFLEIIKEIEKRVKDIVVENTICGATSVRQTEVLELVEQVDMMIVVGGKHSANTKRLEELSLSTNTPTVLIENASQLDTSGLKKYNHIGITAGASTPSWVINEVVNKVQDINSGQLASLLNGVTKALHFLIDTSIFLAIGAVSLYYSIAFFLGVDPFSDFKLPVTIYLFINSVHFLNSSSMEKARGNGNDNKSESLMYRYGFLLSLGFLIVSLILAYLLSVKIFIVHMVLCFSGVIYNKIKFPKALSSVVGFKSLKDIPASKDVSQSIAWAMIIVTYPAIINGISLYRPSVMVAAFFVVCIVYTRSIVYDIKEIRLDKLIGKETFPVLLGDKNTKAFLITLLSVLMGGLIYIKTNYLHYIKIDIFLYSLFYMIIYLYLFHKKIVYKGYALNILIDGQYIFIGLITYLFYA